MNIVHSSHQLLKVLACRLLLESLALDDQFKQFATICKLHHQVQVSFRLNDFVDLNNVRVVHLFQNFDFSRDAFNVFLVFDFGLFQNFDCDLLARQDVRAEPDFAEGALTQGLPEDVVAD